MEGEYSYIVPENVDLEKAKQIALERLKIQLIADEFGTTISQSNSTLVKNSNSESEADFLSIGGSEVKGEWIETIGKPRFDISYEENMLVVRVAAKGRIREIVSSTIDVKSLVLRNGIEDRFESDSFKSGDDLFVSFQSPTSGYLVVYLIDADQRAFCLLPYQNMESGCFPVEANKRYVLFSIKNAAPELKPYVDEYTMTCSHEQEMNQVYVVFSTNSFVKAIDNKHDEGLPRELSYDDFQKWLAKCRTRDTNMVLKKTTITINK
ncbi:DUF4384 domain-containing protein [Leyella stercorea]|uniref:DUF4384 domain-containing protein n=1 Tax=Leyella stercorea TaxID=363265 RepID=UPI00242D8168